MFVDFTDNKKCVASCGNTEYYKVDTNICLGSCPSSFLINDLRECIPDPNVNTNKVSVIVGATVGAVVAAVIIILSVLLLLKFKKAKSTKVKNRVLLNSSNDIISMQLKISV